MVGVALGAAAIGAAGSLASGAMGASASADAAKQQQKMAEMQYVLAQQAFKKNRKELLPYSQFGQQQLPQYEQALNAYQNALPGYGERLNAYDQAVADYKNQGIGGYNQAMADYRNLGIGGVNTAMGQYGQALNEYKMAIPEMTRGYDMEQYKNSPLYTPMVNSLAELQATPGYQFQLQQGQQALGQSAAARGGLLSGAQQKAAQNFAQNQASTGFQSAWERAQSAYQNAFAQNLQRQQQLGNVLTNQANLYNTGVGQAVNLAGLYNTGANQALNNAGLYQNTAGMQGTAANLYGQGLGYQQQNVSNRAGASQFGYGAARDIATMRSNAANVMGQAAGNYGDAGAAGTLAGAGAWQNTLGQLGRLGGAVGNYGVNQGWFGGRPAYSYNDINPPGMSTVIA